MRYKLFMRDDVEAALHEAGRLGLLSEEEPYSKSVLIDALSGAGLERPQAERVFVALRDAVKTGGVVGRFQVEAYGEGRGRKYRLSGLPKSGAAPRKSEKAANPPKKNEKKKAKKAKTARHPQKVSPAGAVEIRFGDNLPILRSLPSSSFDLIYIDPPFNTGKVQERTRVRTVLDPDGGGDRTGFQGKRYRTVKVGTASFADSFDDFIEFIEPRLEEAFRLLKPNGSFFLHIDYREVHYCKVLLDHMFGRESFINELIWAYDYGGRSKKKWSAKHDNILWYAKDPKNYTFNYEEMDRIPYMAPGLVGKEKAARGKTPTDVWWHTIVPTNGKERTGYPTQKPLGLINRVLKVHSNPGDHVLDFFGGSGTTAEAASRLGRRCTLIDNNAEAMGVMASRLSFADPTFHGWPVEAD